MPKRRRPCLSMPAKRHKAQATKEGSQDRSKDNSNGDNKREDPELKPPSEKTYAQWPKYRSFVVKSEDDEAVSFFIGGYGLIVPANAPMEEQLMLHKHWVGKIHDIRARGDDPSEVWAKISWLWSEEDIVRVHYTFSELTALHGRMERFQSEQFDFVHTSCFQADVVHYDERDSEPPIITDETFYVRYNYDHVTENIFPTTRRECICEEEYNPDISLLMHFCPREGCNTAFHARCLVDSGWTAQERGRDIPLDTHSQATKKEKRRRGRDNGRVVPRAIQFERTVPGSVVRDSLRPVPSDWDAVASSSSSPIPINKLSASQTPPARRTTQTRARTHRQNEEHPHRAKFTRHSLLPAALLALARSPMVRGRPSETKLPKEEGCVTGNVAFVVRARKLVRRVVEEGEALPEDWVGELGLPRMENKQEQEREPDDKEGEKKERWREEGVLRWVVEDKGFLCPDCEGVI